MMIQVDFDAAIYSRNCFVGFKGPEVCSQPGLTVERASVDCEPPGAGMVTAFIFGEQAAGTTRREREPPQSVSPLVSIGN